MNMEQLKRDRDVLFGGIDQMARGERLGIVELTEVGSAMKRIGSFIDDLRIVPKEQTDGGSEPEGSGEHDAAEQPDRDKDPSKADEAGDDAKPDNA